MFHGRSNMKRNVLAQVFSPLLHPGFVEQFLLDQMAPFSH